LIRYLCVVEKIPLNRHLGRIQADEMAYKEKTCEQCGVTHKKRGRFCSRDCSDLANKNRKWTAEQKQAVSAGLSKWHKESDTADVATYKWASKGLNQDPDPVAPMVTRDAGYGRFVEDGDIWEEVN